MIFGSLFSGIGGFDKGLEDAGMSCAWQVEIDKNCRNILERHHPGVERYEDVRTVGKHNLAAVDLICGGFPCQDLSVAGARAGLAGERSGLWFEFHRIIAELKPQWVVIENVPGLLSSNAGKDFAVILRGLVELGYGVTWRILDAQYFGVAQRRRRVFIVASLGDGRAAQVLFEREGCAGDTPPSREAGQGVAGTIKGGSGERGWKINAEEAAGGHLQITNAFNGYTGGADDNDAQANHIVAFAIQSNDGGDHKRQDRPNGGLYVNETDTALTVGSTDLTAIAFSARQSSRAYGIAADENVTPPIRAGESGTNRVPTITWHNKQQSGEVRVQGETVNAVTQQWGTGGNNVPFIGVRRLTPVECERLQGFPDGWTDEQADSVRYRQLGNAVCVPVITWIGNRIVRDNRT